MTAERIRRQLDDVDRRLIELLVHDGRLTNRALAAEVGLNEATVAARLRRLEDQSVLAVTAVLDWERAGFAFSAHVFVDVERRAPREVADDLTKIEAVQAVTLVFGSSDLLLHVLAPDRRALTRVLTEEIAAIGGVRHASSAIEMEVLQQRWGQATLPMAEPDLGLPAPVIPLDDLDRSLVEAFLSDGRASLRELARNLDVSDGTIRTRLKRMEDAGLLRIAAQTDPVAVGTVGAIAFVGVQVDGPAVRGVGEQVAEWPETSLCSITSGEHDLMCVFGTPDRPSLIALVTDRLRLLPGVRRTETWEATDVVKHVHQWVRLV